MRKGSKLVSGETLHLWDCFTRVDSAIDSTTWHASRRIARLVRREFPDMDTVVIGDTDGPRAVMGAALRESGLRLVLIPEGLGIYRTTFGTPLPWRQLSGKSALGNRVDGLKRIWKHAITHGRPRASLAWRLSVHLFRVTIDFALRRHCSESSSVDHFDLVVSPWPTEVPLPVVYSRRLWVRNSLDGLARASVVRQPGVTLFLHSPAQIESEIWVEVLKGINLDLGRVVVRSHRDPLGLPELLDALVSIGLPFEVDSRVGPLEADDPFWLPDFFVGVTSTALLNLAFEIQDSTVVSVARRLQTLMTEREDSSADFLLAHQLRALEEYSHGRILFL